MEPHNGNGRRAKPRVVIAGGGMAALETALALRALAGQRATIEIVAPTTQLVYAPMTVAEPFGVGRALTFDLLSVAAELDADLRTDAAAAVDADRRILLTAGGEQIHYDALVVATGASRRAWLPGAITFGGRSDERALRELLALVEEGSVRRLAFAAPPTDGWALPLYELALLTAARLRGVKPRITVVTPEDAPLEAFGPRATEAVAAVLAERAVDCWVDSCAAFYAPPRLQVVPDGILFVDAVVALARLEGCAPAGLPSDRRGFIPIDEYCRVPGADGVYAAGDGTVAAMRQGGLATQQADVVAGYIAAGIGASIEPQPFRPVLRGMLLTGGEALWLQQDGAHEEPPWWPPSKVAGRYLGPYLAGLARSGRAIASA